MSLVPIAKWDVWHAFGPAGWREGVEFRRRMDAELEHLESARARGINPYPDALTADEFIKVLIEAYDLRHYRPCGDGSYRFAGRSAFCDLPRRREPVA